MNRVMAQAAILVVEDEPVTRMALADGLRDAGWRVFEAADADEALAILNAGIRVDLLLTDVQMPGSRDGLALARIAREKLSNVRIVVVSGNWHDYAEGLID